MKAAKTWCLAGLMVVAGLSSASCGKDEGTEGSGGRGTVIGGSGGSGGLPGRSGSSSSPEGGSDGVSAVTKLGRACVTDKDCTDAAAPDLRCITASDTVLTDDGAPPKGLCTQPCTMPQTIDETDSCEALGTGALCYPFTDGQSEGYCLEGCSFGRPDIGETKCHDRPEFACNPALYSPTNQSCVGNTDCPAGHLCFPDEGRCYKAETACMPSCRGDLDCDPGTYCHPGYKTGTCVAKKPTAKRLGEPCTVPADGEPDNECIGFCQPDAATGDAGHCAETCGLGRECAWDAATKKFDGLCFYPSILTNTAETAGLGDYGFCTPSCNCSADCNDPALGCELLEDGPLNDDFRGAGLCYAPGDMTVEYDQCTGAGGAGGESGTGASGASGSPSGGDGSGGVGGAG